MGIFDTLAALAVPAAQARTSVYQGRRDARKDLLEEAAFQAAQQRAKQQQQLAVAGAARQGIMPGSAPSTDARFHQLDGFYVDEQATPEYRETQRRDTEYTRSRADALADYGRTRTDAQSDYTRNRHDAEADATRQHDWTLQAQDRAFGQQRALATQTEQARLRAIEAAAAAKRGAGGAGGAGTDGERKAAAFLPRTIEADKLLGQYKADRAHPAGGAPGVWESQLSRIPLGVGNAISSPQLQTFQNAGKLFIMGVLRPESGATISPAEEQNAREMWIPLPGDSPAVLSQKAMARQWAIQQVRTMGGRMTMQQAAAGMAGETMPQAGSDPASGELSPELEAIVRQYGGTP